MFGRDTVTNLSQLTKSKLRYMGTEDLILDLKVMSSIFQTHFPNLHVPYDYIPASPIYLQPPLIIHQA